MAELWWRYAQIADAPDLLLPVPLHWQRLFRRGFNQAELLARAIQRRHPGVAHTAIAAGLLRRGRATRAQARLGRRERARNTGSAFRLCGAVRGLRVAIVDDVCTTGATANAIAAELCAAGAARVELWCLARTPAPERD
jgi:ComF family protein